MCAAIVKSTNFSCARKIGKQNTCHTCESLYVQDVYVHENIEISKFLMCMRKTESQNTFDTQACVGIR